ncbi:Lipocalin-like domain-containing protein [Segatella bryantii]|uniref:lipocalin-like domain-containing protein n=1 Tax=Segatella bryantii TaxID=77095 RepID=UPI00089B9469|nr:Lipocalin-like domain-containing protein [Segatella bryantii]
MKRIKYNLTGFLFLMMSAVICSSCTLETSDNGDLDGFWHLEAIDTLATGGHHDLSDQKLFWGVEHKLIALQGSDFRFYFRFTYTGDSLKLFSPYINHWHQDKEDGGDIPVDDPEILRPYGIQNLEENFAVEALSGSKMILRSKELKLYFTNF